MPHALVDAETLNSMFDWPPHRNTSPTMMSDSVCAGAPAALTDRLYGPPAGIAGSIARQLPSLPTFTLTRRSPSWTLSVLPGVPVPHTAIGRSRCTTA